MQAGGRRAFVTSRQRIVCIVCWWLVVFAALRCAILSELRSDRVGAHEDPGRPVCSARVTSSVRAVLQFTAVRRRGK